MNSLFFTLCISVLLAGSPVIPNTEADPIVAIDSESSDEQSDTDGSSVLPEAPHPKLAEAEDYMSNPDDPVYPEASFSTDGSQDVPVKTANPVFFWCITGVLAVVVIGGIAVILIRRHRMNSY